MPKYYMSDYDSLEKTELKCDYVGLQMDDGKYYELKFRDSDGEISLSCDNQLLIEPRASNTVRLSQKK